MDKLHVTFTSEDGTKSEEVVQIIGGKVIVNLPNNFRGFVSAYATDKVGHNGSVATPDGVVVEDSNCFINSTSISINLPTTNNYDVSGLPLYNSDISATAEIGSSFAGIRSISWGIGDKTVGSVSVDAPGNVTGDTASIKKQGKNLILNLSDVLSVTGNTNNLEVWVSLEDRAGHVSNSSTKLSIDKDIPTIDVKWDKTNNDGYYNQNRVATITVNERNFDASKFTISGESGTLGTWSNSGDVWTNTITFSEDGDYQFTLDCVDRAGNRATSYSSGKFTIDKTKPVLSVSWDNNSVSNGMYYSSVRKATVTVVDKNFNSNLYTLTGTGTISGWTSNGDTHTATISFITDGEYEFTLSGKDLAGNVADSYSSGKFIIDTVAPRLEISGVENGVSYKKDVGLTIKLSDNYIDTSKSTFTLKGKRNGILRLSGVVNETTGELTFADFPKEEVYDDIYTLTATAVDKAGNVIDNSLVFSVNRFGSSYAFSNTNMLGSYLNAPEDVVITETNVDKLDISKAKISVTLDGKEIDIDSKYISIKEKSSDNGKYSYTYSIDKEAFKEDGKYLVQIYSQAEEGTNYSSVSEEYSFVLDTSAPSIIISGVKSGEKYHEYSKKVTVDIRDMTGVSDIVVKVNGTTVPVSKENGVYSFNVLENKERQSIEVTVVDLAGNSSTEVIDNFLITSETWVFLINQLPFKIGIGAIIAFLIAMISLLVKSRLSSRKEEENLFKQQAKLYQTSTSTGSSSSGEKDLVEDLEADSKGESK